MGAVGDLSGSDAGVFEGSIWRTERQIESKSQARVQPGMGDGHWLTRLGLAFVLRPKDLREDYSGRYEENAGQHRSIEEFVQEEVSK